MSGPPPPPPARLAIFDAPLESHVLSRHAATTPDGRRYDLFRAAPRGEPDAKGWPALYLLDGNAAFDALTPEFLAAMPGLALVGVGYDTPMRFDVAARALDYSPALAGAEPRPDPNRPERMIGGSAQFLDRLCGYLREAAEEGWRVDPARRSLWGHSMAGLCVLHALLTQPGAFRAYAAASPSLWWGDGVMFAVEEAAERGGNEADVLVMLGDAERRSSLAGPHWDGPSPFTLDMVKRLEARAGLKVETRIFPGAGHAAMLPASLPFALELAVS